MYKSQILVLAALACLYTPVISAGVPIPALTEPLVPNRAVPGAASFSIILNGTGFQSGAVVRWNGKAVPSHFISSVKMEALIESTLVAVAGSAQITVNNKGGLPSLPLAFNVSAPTQSLVVTSQVPIVTNTGSIIQIMADVNGDGKPDIVFAYDSGIVDEGFGVALGNGDGTFQPSIKTLVPGGVSQFGIAVGDFVGNGRLDVAIASGGNGSTDKLYVYPGHGDGTFGSPRSTPIPNGGVNFAAAVDVNADGKLDLILANFLTSTATVFLGTGRGTFTQGATVTTGNGSAVLQIADVNGDGKIDLVATNLSANTLDVFLGNGDGTFQLPTSWPVGTAPNSVVIGDLNGDGKLDMVTGSYLDHTVSVLLGNGDGTFQARMTYQMPSKVGFKGIALADFDLNGTMDLLVACASPAKVFVLSGNGDGTFQPPGIGFPLPAQPSTGAITVSDVNGDGKPDLIVAPGGGTSVTVMIQQ